MSMHSLGNLEEGMERTVKVYKTSLLFANQDENASLHLGEEGCADSKQ
jgi:hypothetical protein